MQPRKKDGPGTGTNKTVIFGILLIVLVAAVIIMFRKPSETPSVDPASVQGGKPSFSVDQSPVFNYNDMEDNPELKGMMEDRKAKYNIDNGIDMVVKADESVKIGDMTIRMSDIIEKARLKSGEIVETDVAAGPDSDTSSAIKTEYGIYVVQPADNIWNIHFKLLKNYFERKGANLSPRADEPGSDGTSSGIGKLLKFSEKMVYIYNINDETIDSEINIIQPLSKIVVYNMKDIFDFLEQIDYAQVNQIQFDGETLWLPAEH